MSKAPRPRPSEDDEVSPPRSCAGPADTKTSDLAGSLERELRGRMALERLLVQTVDREQQYVAQLLHDTVSQSLNAARIYARLARDKIERTCPGASDGMTELERILLDSANELHDMTNWLRPHQLGSLDLLTSLSALCELASRKFPCESLYPAGGTVEADPLIQAELLRIAQLALEGIVRRGRAREATLILEVTDEHLVLRIREFSDSAYPWERQTLLEVRARAAGGTLTIDREPGKGSTLTCTLPRAPERNA